MADLYVTLLLLTDSAIRLAAPLVLAALAGIYAERSGVVDIGLEGKMLGAAFAAASAAAVTGSPWAGLLAGIVASLLLALVHGYVAITQRGEQIVSGMAINIAVAGLAPTLANAWFKLNGQTPSLPSEALFRPLTLPLSDLIGKVPVLGPVYSEVLSGHSVLTYLAYVLVGISVFVLYRTRFGLRLRATGENPVAVDTAGVSVAKTRYQAMILAGILCGIAGTVLAIGLNSGFVRDMSAGKGYLALAAVIFGRWRPVAAMLACLLFAFADALQGQLQGVPLPVVGEIPVQFIMMLPYIVTVVVLAGFIGHSRAPKASGIAFTRDR